MHLETCRWFLMVLLILWSVPVMEGGEEDEDEHLKQASEVALGTEYPFVMNRVVHGLT